jgi:hypothetical protein
MDIAFAKVGPRLQEKMAKEDRASKNLIGAIEKIDCRAYKS